MSHIIAIQRTHTDQLYLGYKFSKQYERLMEYTVLMLRQPEIYLNTIFFHNGVQIELTWRHVDTQHMCYGTINLYNTMIYQKGLPL